MVLCGVQCSGQKNPCISSGNSFMKHRKCIHVSLFQMTQWDESHCPTVTCKWQQVLTEEHRLWGQTNAQFSVESCNISNSNVFILMAIHPTVTGKSPVISVLLDYYYSGHCLYVTCQHGWKLTQVSHVLVEQELCVHPYWLPMSSTWQNVSGCLRAPGRSDAIIK